ncbi:fructosamine-3-kinase [Catenulispora sp. GP43]|uniref:fructosamine kinase family protein n=1 Tax=Catenulispora sp. GP43 TaxID=3156263 RepID=UPI003512ABB6
MASTVADRVAALLNRAVLGVAAIGGGSFGKTYRIQFFSGGAAFVKTLEHAEKVAGPGYFDAEAAGLRWLREAVGADGASGGVRVPEVLGVAEDILVTSWIAPGRPTPDGAEEFGRRLASLHARGAHSFGAEWPGYIAVLPLDNRGDEDWATFYVARRVLPYVRLARDRGHLDAEGAQVIEEVCTRIDFLAGEEERPSRIHGDAWSGNILWDGRGEGWFIDPAAHGGHRETDLAMLALFPPPYLDRIIAAYDEVHPLADGWQERVPLHQLHPLLVHAALYGSDYGVRAASVARELAERLR